MVAKNTVRRLLPGAVNLALGGQAACGAKPGSEAKDGERREHRGGRD